MKKDMELNPAQRSELAELAAHAGPNHVRLKARAVLAVSEGMSRMMVARVLGVERRAVGRWVRRYQAEGAAAFVIKEGRGRKGKVVAEELEERLRQAPRHFGIERTRWSLGTLKEAVPSLRGMTDSGVWRALKRLGYRYKRGQPVVHSPDPEYDQKRGP